MEPTTCNPYNDLFIYWAGLPPPLVARLKKEPVESIFIVMEQVFQEDTEIFGQLGLRRGNT